jgi:hypothetical protein
MDGERPLRNAVKAFRQTGALTDSALDREISRALNVDPSPEFLARVRMRVAHETMPAPWRFRWLVLAGAAAVVVFAVVVMFWPAPKQTVPQQAAVPQTVVPAGREAAPAPPAVAPAAPSTRGMPRSVAPRAQLARVEQLPTAAPAADREAEHGLPPFPEVLISADEVRAYQRLLGIAEQQQLPPPRRAAAEDEGGVELHDIELASLRIEALPPLARLEGVRP